MTTTQRRSTPTLPDATWQSKGACRGGDDTLFFHPEGETGAPKELRINAAKAVCSECPVMAQCREYAFATNEQHGIWGGLSEDERAAIQAGNASTQTHGLMIVPSTAKLATKGQGLDPGPVAAHLARLIEAGFTATSIGRFAGVAPESVRAIVKGKSVHVQHKTALRLLSVQLREMAA